MGSSGSESLDCALGSIVWVRRRNGSWWPGKILGPDDLSNTHLMSPRSGTPVKLLGREDASVDWYNLEKSKRVKAFRCGDFDECIERAESSVGMPPKKREKYARREDAILHALELEKQMLDNQAETGRFNISSDIKTSRSSICGEKGSLASSGNQEPDTLNGHNTPEHLSKCVSPFHGNSCHPVNKSKEATMPEDEAPPKMRDLQEFGLRTIPSKRKFSCSVKADEIDRPNHHCQAHTTSAGGYVIGRDNRTNFLDDRKTSPESLIKGTSARGYYRLPAFQVSQNSANVSLLRELQPESHVGSLYVTAPNQIKNAYWAKRNRCMYLPPESYDYLGNVSESSPTLKQVPHFPVRDSKFPLNVPASDDNTYGFSEDTESDSSDSDDSETDSDEMNAVTARGDELLDSIEGSEEDGRLGHMSNEELDELALSDEISLSPDDGVSNWKLKGKRNVRHISKNRSSDIPKAGVGMNDQTYLEMRGNAFNHRISRPCVNHQRSNAFDGYLEGDDSFDRDSALGNTRYSTLRHMPRGRSNNSNIRIYYWDGMALEHKTPLNSYLMETIDYYNSEYHDQAGHVEGRRRNMLVEVDLKVQSSYPKQRVRIISLMSKIDGRAIIGHSLQIEELEEGSSDTLLSKRSEFGNGRLQGEADYALPSVWKTARRTANYRVPRPDLSSAVDSGDYLHLGRKSASRDLSSSVPSLMQKFDHLSTIKGTKKFSKKVSSSQKTRALSSFSVDHQIGGGRHDVEALSLCEIIKCDTGPTTIPCIPVNLVLSRLYEAVGRSPASIAPPGHEQQA